MIQNPSPAPQVAVVVPTIREANITQFLADWQFPCPVFVVEDNPEPTFGLSGVTHYSWADIERDLGANSWIIPRRTDCVRSYGYWQAWKSGAEVIITLDDDCLPIPGHGGAEGLIQQHLDNLQPKAVERWHSTLEGVTPRGVPYETRAAEAPVGISHGLWTNVLDLDSLAQLHYGREGLPLHAPRQGLIPSGQYFPMCGMNLAWRAEYTPLMYFLLMGQDASGHRHPFDRFGDIWCGVIAKRVLDHLGVGVWSGGPLIRHERASNVWANFDKEHAGIKANETFWQMIDEVPMIGRTAEACYRVIAASLIRKAGTYWSRLGEAMLIWEALYA